MLKSIRVAISKDQKIPNAASFTVQREDHTLGNAIRMYLVLCRSPSVGVSDVSSRQLVKDKDVLFAGYKVPHPLEHSFIIKVQTSNTTTPVEAVRKAVNEIISDVSTLEDRFKVRTFFCLALIPIYPSL